MEADLLKKEDEYYRENEKLEQKTKELLQKVNDVMKIQDNLIHETLKTNADINSCKRNNYITNVNPDVFNNHLEPTADCSKKEDELNIQPNISDMGAKGASYFYRARTKCLQTENVKLQTENRRMGEEIKKLQKENQNGLEEKEKWFSSYNVAKNTIGKLESQISLLGSKLQSKDSEMSSLKKELDQVKKELKTANLNLHNFEIRLNRAYEENEKLKSILKITRDEEKEVKESYRKQINDLSATVKRTEKYKLELLNGFKKQLQLIDNLKKQKMYLETLKLADLSELEYLKILDWKLD